MEMFSPRLMELARQAEQNVKDIFAHIDEVALVNTAKVLKAFRENRVDETCFSGTTGYGYSDKGREKLGKIFADIFGGEDGAAGAGFVSGTHAITCGLFGALEPGDKLISAIADPYDTLMKVIGDKNSRGTLKNYGIDYEAVSLTADLKPDLEAIEAACRACPSGAVLIQRSRGYSLRESLSVDEIGEIIALIRKANPELKILVDNCYGEFVETNEPGFVGADLVMGSLIKNPGGGLAPMGGYLVGKTELIDHACERLTVPGIGREAGASLDTLRSLYQGIFLAPHVTAQALKTVVFCAAVMEQLGYETLPRSTDPRHDITQMITFGSPEPVLRFCEGIQAASPVDAYVKPEPWDMPGYSCPVIMAAGTFIQGSSIELSCDAPMREPYVAYLQGGLTYESGKIGILTAIEKFFDK